MCGFIGCSTTEDIGSDLMSASLKMIEHRGPDHLDLKFYKTENRFLYMGHARLSIIDLEEHASQPFNSACGRYTLVYNGEVYNYKELMDELIKKGYEFRTSSDTEVLLYSYIEWGEQLLTRLIGMFSFVIYDNVKNQLFLARDAFGIKPFFYSLVDKNLYFSSELIALLKFWPEKVEPDLQMAYDYLVHGDYDSTSASFISGINHLPPAHYLYYDLDTGEATEPVCWWEPDISTNFSISFDDAVEKLRVLFLESIKLHLRADVPLGVALSGGVDSSAVASAVRYLQPDMLLNTFSYIANDADISEERWVDLLNAELGALPNKVFADDAEMLVDLKDMIQKQGEPFGSTSIYAQYRVFQLAQVKGMKVTLDGQGADELLAGYSGYPGYRLLSLLETKGIFAAHRFAKKWSGLPNRTYSLAWKYLARIIMPDFFYSVFRKYMGRDFKPAWLSLNYLKERGVHFSESRDKFSVNNKGRRVKEVLARSLKGRGLPSLLRHGDRNSMAFSIESRVPFLTIPLANYLLSLPEDYLISDDGITKNVFREAMRGIVPDSHLDRKDKIGFSTPEATWLLNMEDDIRGMIEKSPEIRFLKKEELLSEFEDIMNGKKSFDGRVWRWVNYIYWFTLLEK